MAITKDEIENLAAKMAKRRQKLYGGPNYTKAIILDLLWAKKESDARDIRQLRQWVKMNTTWVDPPLRG